jgi:magnesium chelatase family protein
MRRVLLLGPPGSGKITLAREMARRLKPASGDDAVDLAWIYHGSGLGRSVDETNAFVPFRAPHHTVSEAGLVGGGALGRPGEVSLAHGGCLVLDELPEFSQLSIHALGFALGDQFAGVRARGGLVFRIPARPQLVVACATPCPCGYLGDEGGRRCLCSRESVGRWIDRLALYAERLGIREIVPLRSRTMEQIMSGAPFAEELASW